MSAVKKYAGLPDLDLGTEIYETTVPELTEGSTIPTDADGYSDDGNRHPDFLRQELDTKAARQKFEPYRVNASNVNFSDTIDGGRRDYQIRSKRRRRRAALAREQQDGYTSDESEEETVQGRLARLRREVAELQAEVEKIDHKEKGKDEDGDSDYEDTVDQFHDTHDLLKGTEELKEKLESVTTIHRKQKGISLEEEFTKKLKAEDSQSQSKESAKRGESPGQASLSAIAAFSDRLTLLETALGIAPPPQSQATTPPVVPTLMTLSTQIETLHSVLSPAPDGHVQGPNGPVPQTSTVHLDPIAEKIRFLISESKRLEDSRKAATKSFEELLETRDRHAHLFQTHTTVQSSSAENRLSRHLSSQNVNGDHPDTSSKDRGNRGQATINDQFTPLFLDSQATKISALYNVLPTIQSLQPLLPVVLERLRALSVIHAGAADVKADMDEFEKRLREQEEDIVVWEEALDNAEQAMQENKTIMKENVEVVGGKVKDLEERVRSLASKK